MRSRHLSLLWLGIVCALAPATARAQKTEKPEELEVAVATGSTATGPVRDETGATKDSWSSAKEEPSPSVENEAAAEPEPEPEPNQEALAQEQLEAQRAKAEAKAELAREQARLVKQQAQAERAKEQAQMAKERALTIAMREEGRLIKLQSEQAKLRSQLEQEQARSESLHDQVTALVQQVQQKLEAEVSPGVAVEFEQRVARLLTRVREDLKQQLRAHRQGAVVSIEVHELPTLRVNQEQLEALRLKIVDESEALALLSRELVWTAISLRYRDMRALNQSRLALLSKIPEERRSVLTGFAATGWESVRIELEQMGLELSVRWLRFQERLNRLGQEIVKERQEVAWTLLKLMLLVFVFRWWRQRANDVLMSMRAALLERRKEFPALEHARVVFWYLIKIRSPLEWWLFGWVIAHFWIPETWLEMSLLWTMYKWLVGASLVVAWLNAFATRGIRRRDRLRDRNKALRLQTLGILGFSVMGAGLALEMALLLVGRGALYQWIRNGAWLLLVPLSLYLLVRWRPVVLARCEERSHGSAVARWVHARRSLGGRVLGTLVGALYLLVQGTQQRLGGLLSQFELFRRASAFFYRRDAEQKSDSADEPGDLEPASCASAKAFDPDRLNPSLLDIGPSKRIEKMIAWLDEGRHSLIAVVGERGAGKSSFLARLAADEEQEILNQVIDCPKSGLADLYERIEAQVGASIGDPNAFAERLSSSEKQVICIDNVQRLVKTSIGGLAELDEFVGFARRWNRSVTWILGFGASAWRYTQRARGERAYFDEVVELRPWKEEEIAQLLDDRCRQAGVEPDFSVLRFSGNDEEGVPLTRGGQDRALTAEDLAASRVSFYRILWDYSGGNPGIALHAWSQSLFRSAQNEDPVVRLFEQKAIADVESVSLPALFTLRSLVQMGKANKEELVQCTNLISQDCAGAVRSLMAHGIVERVGPWYRIAWPWCRPVMTVLLRQQLLMK